MLSFDLLVLKQAVNFGIDLLDHFTKVFHALREVVFINVDDK